VAFGAASVFPSILCATGKRANARPKDPPARCCGSSIRAPETALQALDRV
jgi:hypothetical protein